MIKKRILVVEDDESVQDRYCLLFEQQYPNEFIWVLAPTVRRAELVLEKHPSIPVDLIVLDWNLPDADGIDFLSRIKADPATHTIPVLMVTGHVLPRDAAKGIMTGADDYLKKDFGNEEFIARIFNLLSRKDAEFEQQGGDELDGLVLNALARTVTIEGKPLKLRSKEFALLAIFLRRPDIIRSPAYLAGALTNDAEPLSLEAVRQQFRNLRQALGPWGERIETLRGEGYRLNTQFPVSR